MFKHKEIQLDDLVYSYPDINDKEFQNKIALKKEFVQVRSGLSEKRPIPGSLYSHQKFFLRYMLQYDRLLLFHEPGSGKSCTTSSLPIHAIKQIAADTYTYINDYIKPEISTIKRIIYLTKSKPVLETFIEELTKKDGCSAGIYLDPEYESIIDDTKRKGRLRQILNIDYNYRFSTFGTFANKIFKNNLNENELNRRIKEEYSDTYFIVDEAHNLRIQKKSELKEEMETDELDNIEQIEGDEKNVKVNSKIQKDILEQKKIYDKLFKVFHTADRIKIVLLTGTPMVNNVDEIVNLLNLILPNTPEGQLSKNIDYSNVTLEEMEPKLRGMISYIRSPNSQIEIIDKGETDTTIEYQIGGKIVNSSTFFYLSKMHGFQDSIYKKTIPNKAKDFYRKIKSAADFVYPDGSFGNPGFNNFISKEGTDYYIPKNNFRPYLKTLNDISKLSTKYASIIDITNKSKGTSWCYHNIVKGSGCIVLGICFEESGYEKYREKKSSIDRSGKILLQKKNRYGLITSETTESIRMNMKDLFNHYDNRYGEYLKIIIGSKVSSEGLTFLNVTNIHIASSQWNDATIFQAKQRAIRTNSHDILINELRQEAIKNNEDPNDIFVRVNFYKHASISICGDSIDKLWYLRLEEKDIKIRHMYRILKQLDIGCSFNKKRNIRKIEKDNSQICDYDKCYYKCYNELYNSEGDTIDFYHNKILDNDSNFNLYNEHNHIEIEELIKYYLKENFYLVINDFYGDLEEMGYNKIEIDYTINSFITKNEKFLNKLGIENYIIEENGILLLTENINFDDKIDDNRQELFNTYLEYSDKIIKVVKSSLAEYIENRQKIMNEDVENNFNINYYKDININTLNNLQKIKILEYLLKKDYKKDINNEEEEILKKMENFYFKFIEPINSINNLETKGYNIKGKKGRKLNLEEKLKSRKKLDVDILPENPKGDIVYIHILEKTQEKSVSYGEGNRFNRNFSSIKIYKPLINKWNNVSDIEYQIYSELITKNYKEKISSLITKNIYGFRTDDEKTFRFVNKNLSLEDEITNPNDGRLEKTGRLCMNWIKPDLIETLWQLEGHVENSINKEIFYKKFVNYEKSDICKMIEGELEKQELF